MYACEHADVCMHNLLSIQHVAICKKKLSPYNLIQSDFCNVLSHVQCGLLTLMLQNVVHACDCMCILHV